MTNSRRLATLLLLAPGLLAALACAPRRPASPSSPSSFVPASPGATAVRFDNHLGFGLRLESISVRVDGRPVFRQADARRALVPKELGTITLEPGVHAVSVLARVSVACGLLEEPRTSVTVHASSAFRLGSGPAWVGVDLFARVPIAQPTQLPVVAFRGEGVVVGVKETRDASLAIHPWCGGLEPVAQATCDVDAFVVEARADRDVVRLTCSSDHLREIHRLRDVLDEATLVTGTDRTTNELAMHAQLRARYAEARIGQLAASTRQCMSADELAPDLSPAAACPPDALTALHD
jgi:hypothetical protein